MTAVRSLKSSGFMLPAMTKNCGQSYHGPRPARPVRSTLLANSAGCAEYLPRDRLALRRLVHTVAKIDVVSERPGVAIGEHERARAHLRPRDLVRIERHRAERLPTGEQQRPAIGRRP